MKLTYLILFFTIILIAPRQAHAYIDLGLAGSLFQLAYMIGLAILAFVAAPFLFFWKRIRNWIKTRFRK